MTDSIEVLIAQIAALKAAGRTDETIAAYERLLALEPNLPDSWYNLGLMRRQAGQDEAALAAYDEALARGMEKPELVHLNRAVIFADTFRRDDLAEEELNLALAINPEFFPALINLGNLEEDRGNREAARAAYGRVLALRPWYFEVLARYANLHTPKDRRDPVIDRLKRGIAMAAHSPADRAALGFVLGQLLDAVGAYDEAFAAIAAANLASSEAEAPRYDRNAQEHLIGAIIAAFTPERVAALQAACAPSGGAGATPVFICGMFRSGSTLCEQVLASHPDVTMGGELEILPRLVQTQLAPFPDALARLDGAGIVSIAAAYHAQLLARFPGAGIVTDKRTENFLYIGLIKALFPHARIVHTQRDPLDNCLSVYFLHLDGRVAYARALGDIAHYYGQYRRLMAHWQTLFGPQIFTFDYDRFVREQRLVTQELLAYCGLGFDEACLAFHTADSLVRTASVWQVRQPLYARSSGRAQHYAAHLRELRGAFRE